MRARRGPSAFAGVSPSDRDDVTPESSFWKAEERGSQSMMPMRWSASLRMPAPALQSLADHKVKVVAARGSVTDYATDLKGVHPRGWAPGKIRDAVPGAYLPNRNTVVIATTGTSAARRVPVSGEGHGSMNMVVHEASHAIDRHAGSGRNSSSSYFIKARAADLAGLSSYEKWRGRWAIRNLCGKRRTFLGRIAWLDSASRIGCLLAQSSSWRKVAAGRNPSRNRRI